MSEEFSNVYDDPERAAAYAQLEFPGTYYLAYRDLPDLLRQHIHGRRALDFGCGTGRSTRFLRDLGFDVLGVDIAEHMLAQARQRDPDGRYQLVSRTSLDGVPDRSQDLVLSSFTFDNIPGLDEKRARLSDLRRVLGPQGRIVSIVSTPEIYQHEWLSFTTRDYPENQQARSGDRVRIVMLDVPDSRPVEDILCTHRDYCQLYREARLRVVTAHHPLGREDEPFAWVSEATVAPWAIHVLGPA